MNSIGKLISQYRKHSNDNEGKPMSQMELSLIIGWDNPSTLSRIESGIVIPTRNTIIKISKALELPINDINILLKLGNYSEYEPEISEDYINVLRKTLDEDYNSCVYPVYGDIYTWEIIYGNSFMMKFFGYPLSSEKDIYKKFYHKTLIECLFNPYFGIQQNILNWDEFSRIITESVLFSMNLLPKDKRENIDIQSFLEFPDFKKHYTDIQNSILKRKLFNIPFIYKHPFLGIVNFSIIASLLVSDPRISIQQIIPASNEDINKLTEIN